MPDNNRRRKPPHQDDSNAIDRLAMLRYCASGLIAGGAGVTLTMLLTGIKIYAHSYVALQVLSALLLAGCLYFLRSAVRWMGLPIPRRLTVLAVVFLAYQVWIAAVGPPEHVVKAFSSGWWSLVVRAVMTTFFGAGFRFFAEMEMDDLQFGLDHGLGVLQPIPGHEPEATVANHRPRRRRERLVFGLVVLAILRSISRADRRRF
jgi:hypothetical protein